MKRIKGLTKNITKQLFGVFTKHNNIFLRNRILYCEKMPLLTFGIKALIVPKERSFNTKLPVIKVDSALPFNEKDVLSVALDGTVCTVWDTNSPHNALYVTDVCNSKCIMCPQVENGYSRYDECLEILKLVKLNPNDSIGITGGEPTTQIDRLVEVLKEISKRSSKQKVHILTNGRNFAKIENVKKILSIKNLQLSFGIPLYSAVSELHDYIVGVNGAFKQTIEGLYNLARYRQCVEIRTVILRQNYQELSNLAQFIYRNIPFINHVALMGLEYHGNAESNFDEISIDPLDYKLEPYNAVKEFVRRNIIVDIYNTPLCLVDERIAEFCRDSISTWKKAFLPQCEKCMLKSKCAGVFETSFVHSENIKPFED